MTDEKADEKKFNETLKRMLKTPPKPHEKSENRNRTSEDGTRERSKQTEERR